MEMIMNYFFFLHGRPARLIATLGFLLLFITTLFNAQPVRAQSFTLNWGAIDYVDGMSALQIFENISDSGIDMSVEVQVFNSDFSENLGLYVPGLAQIMPHAGDGSFEVRDLSPTAFPGGGYIQTRIIFSQEIMITDIWMEPFYNYPAGGGNVLKHAALQAFDANENAVVPLTWTAFGGSDLIVEAHPGNGEPWLRSTYPITQATYSGAFNISYGNQRIKEISWYSWGLNVGDGSFAHTLGSTLLGAFVFNAAPTAVTLVSISAGASNNVAAVLPILLATAVIGLATTVTLKQRQKRRLAS
jgi:hypothetical protein